jgi:hypothetical protein
MMASREKISAERLRQHAKMMLRAKTEKKKIWFERIFFAISSSNPLIFGIIVWGPS